MKEGKIEEVDEGKERKGKERKRKGGGTSDDRQTKEFSLH